LDKGDNAHKLARSTDWADLGAETFAGIGQRLLATDLGDHAIMDVRVIEMDVEMTADAGPAEDADPDGGGGEPDV